MAITMSQLDRTRNGCTEDHVVPVQRRVGRMSTEDDRVAAYNLPEETAWIEPAAPSMFEAALTMKPCVALMGRAR